MSSKLAFVASLGLILGTVRLQAHHSFEAEYDFNKPLKLTGTVTKVEWMNPHARFYVDVTDENGKVTNWNFELGPIVILVRQGWRKDSLKPGDQVTVEGFQAKDGNSLGNARKVTLPDGRRVFGGSSADNQK
jgi:DNA/RNA endonuclease YhcR with UshA esterase domain